MIRRIVKPVLAFLVIFSLLGPVMAGVEQSQKILVHEGTLPAGATVRVENLLGSVELTGGGEPGKIRVEARVVSEAGTIDDADQLAASVTLDPEVSGDTIWLHVGFPVERHSVFRVPKEGDAAKWTRWLNPLLKRGSIAAEYGGRTVELNEKRGATPLAVHMTVSVPHDVHAYVRQVLGTVRCTRIRGNVEAEAVEGTLVMAQVYGSVRARTGGGGLAVHTAKGDRIDLTSGTGDVEVIDVHAEEVSLTTGGGGVSGRKLKAATLNVDTQRGRVTLEDVETGVFEILSGTGDVAVATLLHRTREAQIHAGSGNVTLQVGRLAPFDLEFESEKGSVKSQGSSVKVEQREKTKARLYRGTGGTDLRVTTDSGKFILKTD